MPGIAKPAIFDEIPTKRPHFFFRIIGKKYFALRKWESRFVAIVFRHVGRSSSFIERLGKYPALFTTISTPPNSRLSEATDRQSWLGSSRSVAITWAPRSANATAIA